MVKTGIKIYQNIFYGPKKTKIVVLGFQKSGTTAIASLLSLASGLKLSSDPIYQIDYGSGKCARTLMSEGTQADQLIFNHPKIFGAPIVKDPDYIFFFDYIRRIYGNAHFVYVSRHPLDTLKSICGRLGITASMMDTIPDSSTLDANNHWQGILAGDYPVIPDVGSHPGVITNLAHRWQYATDVYLKNAPFMHYLKYEDFVANKEQAIFELLEKLDIKPKSSIKSEMDKSFQRSGGIKVTSADFFGEKFTNEITSICAAGMKAHGYTV
jgi:Sulfotransferase family